MLNKQKGEIIIISLIMMLLLTIVGLTGVRISNLEERMSGNFRDHEIAFQSAEATLVEAEAFVENTTFVVGNFQSGCTGSQCFTSTCTNGLCFNGSFPTTGAPASSCSAGLTNPWEDWALWTDGSGKYKLATSLTGTSSAAKYIVEFRCFMVRDDTNSDPNANLIAEWAYSFRITALARGGTADSQVMLQTTYKKI
ncbi:PilX N-terminal domain-containing pilus assembly protein [Psychromonas sp. KJ10-10]|uniref:pilus assembly PilX family protein n=1 Tax=Psychromonas sp. KJ10-10 TaxID=3391823 RepID=UPI0039B400EC